MSNSLFQHVASVIYTRSLDMNIISVDWQRGAEPPYDQAIANARVVALEIINFLKQLKVKWSMKNSLHELILVLF